jgi:Dyp-type peroxidase family
MKIIKKMQENFLELSKRIPNTQELIKAAQDLQDKRNKDPNFIPSETFHHVSFTALGLKKFGKPLSPSKDVFDFKRKDDKDKKIIDPLIPIIKPDVDPENIVIAPDDPFSLGMKARATDLGDLGNNAPDKWVQPFRTGSIDGVIKVASDEAIDANETALALITELTENGISCLEIQKGSAIFNEEGKGIEHFGFRDGVSQPRFRGIDDFSDNRVFEVDEHNPKSFVLHDLKGNRSWANDGSFMVFRRLRQDVPAFWDFMESKRQELGLTTEALAAKFFGRWKSGAPLALFPDNDPQHPEKSDNNDFTYFDEVLGRQDPEVAKIEPGLRTPRFAHIRKVYPRKDGGALKKNTNEPDPETNDATNDTHRILRRGNPYGPLREGHSNKNLQGIPKDTIDGGLLFICFQRDLNQQFEFIQTKWTNNNQFPRGDPIPSDGHGVDAIMGKVPSARFDNLLQEDGTFKRIDGFNEWVTTTGEEYFFSPSLYALQNW